MQKPTYFCDICGAERKQTNHWFIAEEKANGMMSLYPWALPKSEGYHDQPGLKHLCGHQCVHLLIDAWMTGKPVANIEPLTYPEIAQG